LRTCGRTLTRRTRLTFFYHVLQDAAIERQIGDDLLEPRVLFAQLEILSKTFPLLVLSLWRSRS
jgi:hypothetical protein